MHIPSKGLSKEAVFEALKTARAKDFPWRDGKLYAYVFDGGKDVEEVGKRAYLEYLSENALDPTTFPSLLRFENELVDMARRHLGGDEQVVGNFTSGGTESILLAVKTARDAFHAKHPGVKPQMLVPITAHAAFHKAAHYFEIELVPTAVDPQTFRADVAAMRAAMNDRVMLLVASATSYAHGVMDPVEEIAALAKEHGTLCHVDGCIGGFMLPYFRRLGAKIPEFGFAVPGVTSMSMDFHKYALCPKGASVVLYRNEALRKFQLFACSAWTGYTMINNTIQSTKSGGPMAAAWSVLQYVGDEGYLQYAKGLLQARDRLIEGINAIPGLRVLSQPEMCLLGFTSDELSVFSIADEMKARGFHVQAQLGYGPSPANIHLSINPSNVPWSEELLKALAQATDAVRKAGGGPKPPVEFANALAQQVNEDVSGESLRGLVASIAGGGSAPENMAETNALMEALPPEVRERLLVAFVGQLFTPSSETPA